MMDKFLQFMELYVAEPMLYLVMGIGTVVFFLWVLGVDQKVEWKDTGDNK